MNNALPIFIVIPLLGAALLIFTPRFRLLRHIIFIGVPLLSLLFSVLVLIEAQQEILVSNIGGWPASASISFIADPFSALMLTATSMLILFSNIFATISKDSNERYFAPLVLILSAGVYGALLTADLFNLFVFIELMFLPSCGLVVMRKGLQRIGAARLYVNINLLTSSIFVVGVGFIYASTGTVNLAGLANAAANSEVVAVATGICLIALSVKAGLVPVHGWISRTYPATSPVVAALFSGLHTKVAVYAFYRIYSVMFGGDSELLYFLTIAFAVSMVVGALAALGETSIRSVLSFHMVSQIGYIMLGVALFGKLGLTAGIFYLIHHMIVKASMFFSTAAIEETYGSGYFKDISNLLKREPLIAIAFFAGAMSLSGIPPFSGFVAKFSLLTAAVDKNNVLAICAIILASIITLMAELRIWSKTFWPRQSSKDTLTTTNSADMVATAQKTASIPIVLPGLLLASMSLFIGINADFLFELSSNAADSLINIEGYVQAVMQ